MCECNVAVFAKIGKCTQGSWLQGRATEMMKVMKVSTRLRLVINHHHQNNFYVIFSHFLISWPAGLQATTSPVLMFECS